RDAVDARLLHPVEELTGVGREALDVTSLALGVEHVERERGFSGPGHARHHREGTERHPDVDALQVVLAGTEDLDRGLFHEGVYGCGRRRGRGTVEYTAAVERGKRPGKAGAPPALRAPSLPTRRPRPARRRARRRGTSGCAGPESLLDSLQPGGERRVRLAPGAHHPPGLQHGRV